MRKPPADRSVNGQEEGWLAPRRYADLVFFDGNCGLCHGSVLFLLAREPEGEPKLRFAPLAGTTFKERLPEKRRRDLPDSLVILSPEGSVYFRGRAVRRLLDHLGGVWRAMGLLLRIVPLPLLDLGYRCVAAMRHRLFRRPASTCPLVPPELRGRFLG